MQESNGAMRPEDYIEPRCLICDDPYGVTPEVKSVPQGRIIEKMDEYMSRRDYAGAERHLVYWLEEAKLGHDERGQLLLYNELVGHYRKVGDRDRAFAAAENALALLDRLDFSQNVSAGTTYTNVATAMSAFGRQEEALALFEKARAVYEAAPRLDPALLGGLYNNMALTLTALGRYGEAHGLFDKAMDTMKKVPGGQLEEAITCLNRADTVAAEDGLEAGEKRIDALLEEAWELLNTREAPRDGYYAFVSEKCAPTFSYYGWFAAAQELKARSKAIYERT